MITEATAEANRNPSDGGGDATAEDEPMTSRRRMLRTLALGAAGRQPPAPPLPSETPAPLPLTTGSR